MFSTDHAGDHFTQARLKPSAFVTCVTHHTVSDDEISRVLFSRKSKPESVRAAAQAVAIMQNSKTFATSEAGPSYKAPLPQEMFFL